MFTSRRYLLVGIDFLSALHHLLQILVFDIVSKKAGQKFECRSIFWVVIPAAVHDFKHFGRAQLWLGEPLIVLYQFDHVDTFHVMVGWRSEGEHFPHRYPEGPHIARVGECAVVEALWCVPGIIVNVSCCY